MLEQARVRYVTDNRHRFCFPECVPAGIFRPLPGRDYLRYKYDPANIYRLSKLLSSGFRKRKFEEDEVCNILVDCLGRRDFEYALEEISPNRLYKGREYGDPIITPFCQLIYRCWEERTDWNKLESALRGDEVNVNCEGAHGAHIYLTPLELFLAIGWTKSGCEDAKKYIPKLISHGAVMSVQQRFRMGTDYRECEYNGSHRPDDSGMIFGRLGTASFVESPDPLLTEFISLCAVRKTF